MQTLNIFSFFEYFLNQKHTIEEFAVHFESIEQDYSDLGPEDLDSRDLARYRRTFHRYKNKLADEYQIDMEIDLYSDREKRGKPVPTHYIPKDLTGHAQAFLRLCHYQALNQLFHSQESGGRETSDYIFTDDRSEYFAGTRHLNLLLDAIRNQKEVSFSYRSREAIKPGTYRIRPHFLKEYSGRWYMVGLLADSEERRMFSLDRMEQPEVLSSGFRRIPSLHEKMGFEQVVGVEKVEGRKPLMIRVAMETQVAHYLENLPIHHSQKTEEKNRDHWIFSFFLIPNQEFYQQLLMWAERLEVISPEPVRTEYVSRLKRGLAKHTP